MMGLEKAPQSKKEYGFAGSYGWLVQGQDLRGFMGHAPQPRWHLPFPTPGSPIVRHLPRLAGIFVEPIPPWQYSTSPRLIRAARSPCGCLCAGRETGAYRVQRDAMSAPSRVHLMDSQARERQAINPLSATTRPSARPS